MIFRHGISLTGDLHVARSVDCQDAHAITLTEEGVSIAAVADGWGTAEYSADASRIAVEVSTSHCKKHMSLSSSSDDICAIIKNSFFDALCSINEEAEAQGRESRQYYTTLSLAVLIGDTLYYGHSGDSGIIALTVKGLYVKVTTPQTDDNGDPINLAYWNRWDIGQFDQKVCSVLLATDGVLLYLIPRVLGEICVSRTCSFMDNRLFRTHIEEHGEEVEKTRINDDVMRLPPQSVNCDDKTIVVLVDTSAEPELQPDDYYKEPDWVEISCRREEEWKQTQLEEQKQRELSANQLKEIPDVNSVDESEQKKERWIIIKFLWTIKEFFKNFFTKNKTQ